MILDCPNCETKYEIPVQLPPEGRKVRCASCQHIWQATPQEADQPPPPEEAVADADAGQTAGTEPGDPIADTQAAQEEGPAPDLSGLDEIAENEIVFKDNEEDAADAAVTETVSSDTETEPAESGDGKQFSESAMEEAFSAAIAEAGIGKTALDADIEEEPESPPIVIGKAKRKGRGSLPVSLAAGWAALALFVTGTLAVGYFQRVSVVRLLPGTASAYERIGLPVNVRGLEFEGVKYSWESSAGRTMLEVFGDIVNITDEPLRIPTVVFGLRTKEKVEVYQWAADVRNDKLPPGERAAFSAQIPSPPKSIRDVQVRFAKVR